MRVANYFTFHASKAHAIVVLEQFLFQLHLLSYQMLIS